MAAMAGSEPSHRRCAGFQKNYMAIVARAGMAGRIRGITKVKGPGLCVPARYGVVPSPRYGRNCCLLRGRIGLAGRLRLAAGDPPETPGLLRKTPSVTMQKLRTPVWLKATGAEPPQMRSLVPPLPEKARGHERVSALGPSRKHVVDDAGGGRTRSASGGRAAQVGQRSRVTQRRIGRVIGDLGRGDTANRGRPPKIRWRRCGPATGSESRSRR